MPKPSSAYLIRISSRALGGEIIKAWMPEELRIGVESTWDSPFSDVGSGLSGNLLSLGGVSLKTKSSSIQVWQGSSPIEMTLPLIFIAETNSSLEVVDPIVKLQQLTIPGLEKDGERFIPPGPSLFDLQKKAKQLVGLSSETDKGTRGDLITIRIGKFVEFRNVILTNVSSNFKLRMSPEGSPMEADAEVTFRTFTQQDKDSLAEMYGVI